MEKFQKKEICGLLLKGVGNSNYSFFWHLLIHRRVHHLFISNRLRVKSQLMSKKTYMKDLK